MFIYVDESGTFAASGVKPEDSWCVVAAYVSPESDAERVEKLIEGVRADCGEGGEVKIHQIDESRYIRFLRDCSRLSGLLFAVGVDISLHSEEKVAAHQRAQADKIIEHREKLQHELPRTQLTELREELLRLPLQLYTQLQSQIELFHAVLSRAPLYYSQHKPEALGKLSWRVDQKDTIPTRYEKAFRALLPSSLQSKSLREPMIALVEGNYEYFRRFEFPAGEYPTYLEDHYGIKTNGSGLHVGKMVTEDFNLVDSNVFAGVQIADLMASGLRRLMRGRFERSHEVALLLGSNMAQELRRDRPVVRLISLDTVASASERTARLLGLMKDRAKPLVV